MTRENLDKNLAAFIAMILAFVLFLMVYYLPRNRSLHTTQETIRNLQGIQQEVSVLLPEVARTAPTAPMPTPDVRSWVANNALVGFEKNLVANDGYLKGQGAQVKLRRLSPEQAGQFLSSLTRVRLIVDRMQLQDLDSDGSWDIEISLKVPE